METPYQQIGTYNDAVMVAMRPEFYRNFQVWAISPDEEAEQEQPVLRVLSAEQFAKEIDFSVNTVREWCKTIIREACSNLGNKWLIDAEKAKRILLSKQPELQNELEFKTPRNSHNTRGKKSRARHTKPTARA